MQHDHDDAGRRLLECRARLAYTRMKLAERDATIANLHKTIRLIYQSSSWRLTAPLRKLAWFVKHR